MGPETERPSMPDSSPEPSGEAPPVTRDLAEEGVLEAALASDLALLYKYSPICPLSDHASAHIGRFMREHPELPVFDVDVIRGRETSRALESLLEVRHESPQAILLRSGTPVWVGSHTGVNVRALEQALQSVRTKRG